MLLLLAACHSPGSDGLYGTPPDREIPLPTFTVRDSSGEERTRDALIGHPTVVWFYPSAGTSG